MQKTRYENMPYISGNGTLKNFVYFRRELAKPENQIKKSALKKVLIFY